MVVVIFELAGEQKCQDEDQTKLQDTGDRSIPTGTLSFRVGVSSKSGQYSMEYLGTFVGPGLVRRLERVWSASLHVISAAASASDHVVEDFKGTAGMHKQVHATAWKR